MITTHKIKIAIAEDCKITRDLLKGHLSDVPEFSVIIEAPNGKLLLQEITKNIPDIAILDVRMDVMDGVEAAFEIKKFNKEIRIIAWSAHNDIHTIFKMLDAGATAFLDKDANLAEMKKCICSVNKEGHYYNHYFTSSMHESILRGENHLLYGVGEVLLTDDEIELTKNVCKGMNNKEIADYHQVGIRKIQKDIKNLLLKTNTGNLPQLVTYAYRNGIISFKDTEF